ncbi:MAG: T9SS type A sorting domain-containing protein [Chitinophagales bacterium]|nr:T9SS type A sorting domain-containing protein [Chitinophagales bacterium]
MGIFTNTNDGGKIKIIQLVVWLLLFLPCFSYGQAQTFTMANTTITLSGTYPSTYTFYDPGGSGGTNSPCAGTGVAPDYPNNANYVETFYVGTGQSIVVAFITGAIAANDYLYIYDGPSTASTLLATYTNVSSMTSSVGSSSNSITFKFTSDATVTCKGWQATFTRNYFMQPGTYSLDCNSAYFSDPSTAHVTSTGSTTCNTGSTSGDYLDSQNMVQTFCTGGTQYITATWNSGLNPFYICASDILKVYDGNSTSASLMQTYTNLSAAPAAVSSSGSCITFEFVSDGSSHEKGWNAALSCGTIVTPANDNCTGAISVTAGSPCTSTPGTTQSATASGSPTVASGTPNDDVWYSFVATTSNPTITVTGTGASMQPVAQLCVGPNTSPTQSTLGGTVFMNSGAALGTATLTPTGLTTGTTYYVRVFDASASNAAYTFTICITGATQQDCAGALNVNSYFSLSGTATSYGAQEYNATSFGCLVGGEHRSLWYKMKVTSAGSIAFSLTPATGQDIDFAIWGPTTLASSCTITQSSAPLRCTFAANGGSVGGLSDSYTDATEGAVGDGWLRSIGCPTCTSSYGETAVAIGQYYTFLIDGWSSFNGNSLTLTWTGTSSLPIILSDFHGESFFDYNQLDWATASEYNNDFWTIERSADGEVFEPLTVMEGYDNSTTSRTYQYYDRSPLNGNNYYRLKQTDIGGTYTYSNIVLLKNFGKEISVEDIYPNPTNGSVTLNLYAGENYQCIVRVLDETGKEMFQYNEELIQGNNFLHLDVSQLHTGIYFLQLMNPRTGNVQTKKLVKM